MKNELQNTSLKYCHSLEYILIIYLYIYFVK